MTSSKSFLFCLILNKVNKLLYSFVAFLYTITFPRNLFLDWIRPAFFFCILKFFSCLNKWQMPYISKLASIPPLNAYSVITPRLKSSTTKKKVDMPFRFGYRIFRLVLFSPTKSKSWVSKSWRSKSKIKCFGFELLIFAGQPAGGGGRELCVAVRQPVLPGTLRYPGIKALQTDLLV